MKASRASNLMGSLVFALSLAYWVASGVTIVFEFFMLEASFFLGLGLWLQMKERQGLSIDTHRD